MTRNATSAAEAVTALGRGLTATLMFLTMVIAAFLQSVLTATVLTGTALLLFIALRPLSRVLRRYAKQLSTAEMEFTNTVQQVVQIAEETEVFGAGSTYRRGFTDQVEDVRRPLARTRLLAVALPARYQTLAL